MCLNIVQMPFDDILVVMVFLLSVHILMYYVLKNVLTEDEYRVVSGEKVQYRFKYLKFLNKK